MIITGGVPPRSMELPAEPTSDQDMEQIHNKRCIQDRVPRSPPFAPQCELMSGERSVNRIVS